MSDQENSPPFIIRYRYRFLPELLRENRTVALELSYYPYENKSKLFMPEHPEVTDGTKHTCENASME
jgi:hypothetical protein